MDTHPLRAAHHNGSICMSRIPVKMEERVPGLEPSDPEYECICAEQFSGTHPLRAAHHNGSVCMSVFVRIPVKMEERVPGLEPSDPEYECICAEQFSGCNYSNEGIMK